MTITNSSLRLVALVTGVAVALALMGAVAIAPAQAAGLTQTQIQSIVSLLASFGADQATINNVTAALNGQATPGTGGSTGGTTGGACPALTRDLQQGSSGADVKALQVFLNGSADTMVASTGAGSPGNETTTFGPATKAAVIKFQTKYNVTPIAGYVGAKTRAQIASVCGTTGGNTGGNTGGTTGGMISVGASAQPVNSLAPQGASRVPFTTFTLTNNSSQAVTVNSVTVQRTGLGVDSNFAGIVLLDSNGLQIGTAKTLNSNHQANIGDTFTIGAGQSMTFTVAGNIASSISGNSGQIVSLQVVAINTSATVSGSLPITGASQTINTTLTLGSVSTSTSSFDPGTATNKNLGDTGVRFSGVKFTASSAEDIKLYSIRWRQVGTASNVDIANVMTYVNGTSYPTTISADGKYYTTVFPGGITIAKGNTTDVYVQGDLVGSNSASRTVRFDIDKSTDVYFVGQTYGYGVAVSGTYTPWFQGYTATINPGTVTLIGKANEVAAQNIAVNVPNQALGGFVTNFAGEAVSVQGMTFTIATSSGSIGTNAVTSVSIVDENGAVVAGPVDATNGGSWSTQTVTFTDTVTFPTGRHVYTVKGKIPSSASNGTAVYLQTTPSNWSSPTGQTSGNSITIGTSQFDMNTMTVKAATLSVTASVQPASQNIVAGVQNLTVANIQIDASQSGEDLRISGLPIYYENVSGSPASQITGCQVWDGTTALNTGSRVVNSLTTASTHNFQLDNSLTIPKGTVKTLAVSCNIGTSASGAFRFGVNGGTWSATGVTSGTSLNATLSTSYSGTMTVASGSFTAAVDTATSPSRTMVAGGSTGVTVGTVKFRASNEAVNLTKVGLTLSQGTYGSASTATGGSSNNGVGDVIQAYIYDGSTLVGTATFTGSSQTATSTLTTSVTLPKDTDKVLTIKADLAAIGTSGSGGIGDIVKIDPLNAEGSGLASGQTLRIGATSGVGGVQLFKSYPTVTAVSNSATNPNGANVTLKRFTITSNSAGPIGISKISVSVATSSATVTDLKLFAYTDSGYSQGVSNQSSGTGQVGSTVANLPTNGTAIDFDASPVLQVSGTTYLAVLGTVTPGGSATNWSVNVTVLGDSTTPGIGSSPVYIATTTSALSSSNFIWSGNSSTTAASTNNDWWNGYFVPGLSSTGI